MKQFELDDTFLLSQIINDLDIELDLNQFLDKTKNNSAEYVGGQFFYLLIKRWHKGKKSIPEFIAVMSEQSVEEARKMKIPELKEFFIDLFKQEGVQDFFTSASDELK